MNCIRRIVSSAGRICYSAKRSYLSESYKCQEAWDQRLESPIIKKLNLDALYQELDQAFQSGKGSAVDVDLFSNKVVDSSYADELEDVVHKLRLSSNTTKMLPSTPHAVMRAFLSMGKYDAIARILNDRLNYGIFPDYYCLNLAMDTFIKEKQYKEAAKIATFQMLQEDWEHPVTAYLGLLSCHLYLKSEKSEPWEEDIEENNEPEEEVKIRVRYIRNAYFDDHFDLKEPYHLIGKTFVILAKSLPNDDPVRITYELVGWALYEKWDKAKSMLQTLSLPEEKKYILSEGVHLLEKAWTDSRSDQLKEEAAEFLKLIKGLPSPKLQEKPSLLDSMEERLKKAISEEEEKDITQQISLYKEWEKVRQQALEDQTKEYEREVRLKKVNEKKEEISKKEEILFFFENKDKLDIMIEENEKLKAKIADKKTDSKETDDDYIPPDVK